MGHPPGLLPGWPAYPGTASTSALPSHTCSRRHPFRLLPSCIRSSFGRRMRSMPHNVKCIQSRSPACHASWIPPYGGQMPALRHRIFLTYDQNCKSGRGIKRKTLKSDAPPSRVPDPPARALPKCGVSGFLMQVPVPSYYFYSFFRLAQQIERKNGQRKKRWPYFFIHSLFYDVVVKRYLTLESFNFCDFRIGSSSCKQLQSLYITRTVSLNYLSASPEPSMQIKPSSFCRQARSESPAVSFTSSRSANSEMYTSGFASTTLFTENCGQVVSASAATFFTWMLLKEPSEENPVLHCTDCQYLQMQSSRLSPS